MATSTAVPIEEYLRTTYHPDREYVDGQLLERHVGEYYHSRTQTLIVLSLGAREREYRFRIFTEQRVRVNDEPRYRIPDICVKALPHKVMPVLERPDLAIGSSRPTMKLPRCWPRSRTALPLEFRIFGWLIRTSANFGK
ncbi:MAG TPA: hypothetical protein VGZ73_01555 [Bryobacteraceae bacterium]|jgi:Uma2 family endonuclease|nr:hypothetical protein [Bryobacteraceae bacterium]